MVGRKIFLVDNMLATAGSSILAIKHLQKMGCSVKDI